MLKKIFIVVFLFILLFCFGLYILQLIRSSSPKIRFISEIPQTEVSVVDLQAVETYLNDIGFWESEIRLRKQGVTDKESKGILPASLTVVVKEGQGGLDKLVTGGDDSRVYRSYDWETDEKRGVFLYILLDLEVMNERNINRNRTVSIGFIRGAYLVGKGGYASKESIEEITIISNTYSPREPLVILEDTKLGLLDGLRSRLAPPVSADCVTGQVECGDLQTQRYCSGDHSLACYDNDYCDDYGVGYCDYFGTICIPLGITEDCGDLPDYWCEHDDVCNLFLLKECDVSNTCCLMGACVKNSVCHTVSGSCVYDGYDNNCNSSCWDYCSPDQAGCEDVACPTTCGYPGGTVEDDAFSTGCTCAEKTCPETAPCASPTPTTIPNSDPVGNLDGCDCNNMFGWTCDADSFSTPLDVHFYDGATFIGSTTANLVREPAVAALCGADCIQPGIPAVTVT